MILTKKTFCILMIAIIVFAIFVICVLVVGSQRGGTNSTPDFQNSIPNTQPLSSSTLSNPNSMELSFILQNETIAKLRVFHLDKLNINYYMLTDDYQLILVKGKVSNISDPTCPVIKEEDVVMYKTLTLQKESKEYIDLLIDKIYKNNLKNTHVFDAETLKIWIGNDTFIEFRLHDTYSPLFEMYDFFESLFS